MSLLVSIFALALACVCVQGDKLFSLQTSSGVTLLLRVDGRSARCEIITNKDHINKVLKSSDGAHIRPLSKNKMDFLLRFCSEEQTSRADEKARGFLRKISKKNFKIFPGTLWCGAGSIANNYEELGSEADTDRCCRTHDHCDDLLLAGQTRHNLTNKSSYTKLSCQCDADFYKCLRRVNTKTSNAIGHAYFNVLKSKCYKKEYPECKNYERSNCQAVYKWVPAETYIPNFSKWFKG